jgi:hypothetical protein
VVLLELTWGGQWGRPFAHGNIRTTPHGLVRMRLCLFGVDYYFIARLMRSLHALKRTADSLRFSSRPIAFALFFPAILRNSLTWAAVQ